MKYRKFLPFNQYLDNTPKEDRERERFYKLVK